MPNYEPSTPCSAEEAPTGADNPSAFADQMPDYAPPASHDAEEAPELSDAQGDHH